MIERRKSKQINIGNVKVGGDAPVSVQSMCNTDTCDVEATLRQINELANAGCEIVRLAVLNADAAAAIKEIVKKSPVPLVADIHFDYKLALGAIENGADKLRINPGNINNPEHIKMVADYAQFDFGKSYYKDKSVWELIKERMPVSVSLGLWSTLIIYLVAIPLGIKKAVRDGTKFDVWTSFAVIVGAAIPVFLFAVFLIVFFAGGTYWQWFPLRGLTSANWDELSWPAKIADYFWHITLPVLTMVIGGFASLTMLTKNSFIDEINKPYVLTAKAKGLTENQVLYGHVFRNAMLIVIAGFPNMLIKMLFTGALLIEVIFSLNGLGLLGYEAIMTRDYPVIFGTLYIFALLGLILKLISDITYSIVDPRINFEAA